MNLKELLSLAGSRDLPKVTLQLSGRAKGGDRSSDLCQRNFVLNVYLLIYDVLNVQNKIKIISAFKEFSD